MSHFQKAPLLTLRTPAGPGCGRHMRIETPGHAHSSDAIQIRGSNCVVRHSWKVASHPAMAPLKHEEPQWSRREKSGRHRTPRTSNGHETPRILRGTVMFKPQAHLLVAEITGSEQQAAAWFWRLLDHDLLQKRKTSELVPEPACCPCSACGWPFCRFCCGLSCLWDFANIIQYTSRTIRVNLNQTRSIIIYTNVSQNQSKTTKINQQVSKSI